MWPTTFVSDATLVGLIKELRRALDDRDRAAPIIRTVQRVGYAFCLPLDTSVPNCVALALDRRRRPHRAAYRRREHDRPRSAVDGVDRLRERVTPPCAHRRPRRARHSRRHRQQERHDASAQSRSSAHASCTTAIGSRSAAWTRCSSRRSRGCRPSRKSRGHAVFQVTVHEPHNQSPARRC